MQEAVQVRLGPHLPPPLPPEHSSPPPLIPQTYPIESRVDVDPDVFKSMSSLGCFKDKQALMQALLSQE